MVGAAWVRRRGAMYRRASRRLHGAELAAMGPYFSGELLEGVRLALVDRLESPRGSGVLRLARLPVRVDLAAYGGMALGDVVVIVDRRGEGVRAGTLFHELVHVAQYRALGVRGFVREYVRGWLEGGREYRGIPLEQDAYELQERFARGERFDAEAATLARLAGRGTAPPRRPV